MASRVYVRDYPDGDWRPTSSSTRKGWASNMRCRMQVSVVHVGGAVYEIQLSRPRKVEVEVRYDEQA